MVETKHKNRCHSSVHVFPKDRKKKKIWIPVTLPNIHLNKNGTAPKEKWEGQRVFFPMDLLLLSLGKREMEQRSKHPRLCSSAWLNNRTLKIDGSGRLSVSNLLDWETNLFPTKEKGINPAHRFVPAGMGGKGACC